MESPSWLDKLRQIVRTKPLVFFRFDPGDWERLQSSYKGVTEFTIARSHTLLEGVRPKTPCLIQGKFNDDERLYFGLISSIGAVTTLESRVKIRHVVQIDPESALELVALTRTETHVDHIDYVLLGNQSIARFTPDASKHLIETLSSIEKNQGPLRVVAESLEKSEKFDGVDALQEDAINTALKAFGLAAYEPAVLLELIKDRPTRLARIDVREDAVVEHDARQIPGYDLVGSHATGRARFEKNGELLEVFTANKRPLEEALGVDLIYLNLSQQNMVLLQYKMLEPEFDDNHMDWIYRPDKQLIEEIDRMKRFSSDLTPDPLEYRLNPACFYLKFVKRDGFISNGSIFMTIDHFDKLSCDPKCRGPRGGFRITYESLAGRYLRQTAFLDLVRSGYIGTYAKKTDYLRTLIEAILKDGKALVVAIQQPLVGKLAEVPKD